MFPSLITLWKQPIPNNMLYSRTLIGLLAALTGLVLASSCSQKEPNETDKPGNTPMVWYVNPGEGSDDHSGDSKNKAWKTFAPLKQLLLGPADRVVVSPGVHTQSLVPRAHGEPNHPAVIEFLPGIHEFAEQDATRQIYFISNSVATSTKPMPIAILAKNCKHLVIKGSGTKAEGRTTILMGGRMTHFVNDQSEGIRYSHLVFDLKRPTVSEFRVVSSTGTNTKSSSEIVIADGSTAELRDGKLQWTGDLGNGTPLMQEAIPAEGRAWRKRMQGNNPLEYATRTEALGENLYRLHFEGHAPLTVGHQFQFRNGMRDVVGAHNTRSRDIVIEDVSFHAFAGMGIISQFTENLTYRRVMVVPPKNSLRTCAAWADGFHYSGCRGQIIIEDCVFSGLQDDPVNVHGTHLQIVESPASNQLLVRFIHKQTYGFAAFQPGDTIAVIHSRNLREHPNNPRRKVTAVKHVNDRDWLLTLDGTVPRFEENDVIDNISWYPDLTIRGCKVDMCPTRGFLVTTRGKVLIEGNTLKRCRMPGLLIENDASGWFESGPVRDMLVRNNHFIGCDIRIHPRVKTGNLPVHENIRILENEFSEGAGIDGHHVSGLVISHNRSDGAGIEIKLDPNNTESVVTDNQ
ncbi:MAG: right-handed parallel beta-helix repeat-containing protein [Verrucomicrobiae bacterium]|nr:right-handed parallel beta-helix repeat-containing protein [Verrucomicrobiae bacterium]NNJ87503.1 hypothetical protein [Akkermansiaceae bacterium]